MNINISSQETTIEEIMNDSEDFKKQAEKSLPTNHSTLCVPGTCSALVVLHLSCGERNYSRIKNTRAKDINEAMLNVDSIMVELKKDVEYFKIECEDFSQVDLHVSKDDNSYISCEIQTLENSHTSSVVDKEQEFKQPIIDSNKNRFSSSTSSSSLRPSSTAINRYSTASSFSQSTASVDIQKTDSDEQMVISETSESAVENIGNVVETTIVETQDYTEYLNVYARWKTDKFFYSGKTKFECSVCEVIFDDDSRELVKTTDILFTELLPKGTEVSVELDKKGDFVKNYLIKDHVDLPKFRSKPKRGYRVLCQVTNKYFNVSRECVSVHMDIAKRLMKSNDVDDQIIETNMNTSDISMDNILFGKREQKRKRFSQYLTLNDLKPKKCASPSINNLSLISNKSRYNWKRSCFNKNEKDQFNISGIGIFSNCYFMITGSKEDDTSESIEQTIHLHNGIIIEIPSLELVRKYKNNECQLILIVMDSTIRTVKFMAALAIGEVPIVNEKWFSKCVQQSKLIDYFEYLLPRGTTKNDVQVSINLFDKSKIGLFYDKNIWVVTDNFDSFGKNWQTILELSGAEVFIMETSKFSTSICNQNCHFVVVEQEGVTHNCLKRLRDLEITILDISYIKECLICNDVLSTTGFVL